MTDLTLSSEKLTEALPGLLAENGCVSLRVTGYSMRPLLRHNQDVVWLRSRSSNPRPGQILLYQRFDGKLVLHRMLEILSENRYRMNGDAQVWCEIIHDDQILAEVFEIQRGSKRIRCGGFLFKLQAKLWSLTRPIRPTLFQFGHRFKELLRQ